MQEVRVAKLFQNGASQAVRLPAEFRFEGDEVYVTRDELTGDVILSKQPGAHAWSAFFELIETIEIPADFMASRPLNQLPAERNLFGEST